ncbi:MAG: translocase [Bryobacteraceae bacterium]|nr:translocase [Bryobacteraceae bacterium]
MSSLIHENAAVPQKSIVDRALSLFTTVRAGEGATALLLGLNVFVLLASYYLLKTIREALILAEAGAQVKSYASAVQAVLLLLAVPAYGLVASKVNRTKLISLVTGFFISNLLLFYVFGKAGFNEGVVFFLWVGIFNNFVVAQFWAFANDLYTEEQGKRLFPVIGVGTSLGAVLGAWGAKRLFGPLDAYQIMLLASAGLIIYIGLTILINRRESAAPASRQRQLAAKPLGSEGGFQLVLRSRYLRMIALLILVLNVVNTTGEFLIGDLVLRAAEAEVGAGDDLEGQRKAFVGRFYGDFFFWVNTVSLLIQMFAVSRVFRYIGVRGALFVLPLIALGGYSLLAFYPMLAIVRGAKILENSTDYSLQNTIRHALFLPTSREAKYKAKAAVDTFFVRIGDMLQAGVVAIGSALSFTVTHFAYVNIALVCVWLGLAAALYREHKRITEAKAVAAPA